LPINNKPIALKHFIDLENWERRDHFEYFSRFSDPFWGVTLNVDCTRAYRRSKEENNSFYLYYLFQSLRAVNMIEAFKLRIENDRPVRYDRIDASATVDRPDGSFGFSCMIYYEEFNEFQLQARKEISRVRAGRGLETNVAGQNVIHYSAVPWISFTSLSHASHSAFKSSIPKISFGKTFTQSGQLLMPVAIHAHHALIDGLQAGKFVELYQKFLKN
jgi:chloramphenicol O-acetyltransferase type A